MAAIDKWYPQLEAVTEAYEARIATMAKAMDDPTALSHLSARDQALLRADPPALRAFAKDMGLDDFAMRYWVQTVSGYGTSGFNPVYSHDLEAYLPDDVDLEIYSDGGMELRHDDDTVGSLPGVLKNVPSPLPQRRPITYDDGSPLSAFNGQHAISFDIEGSKFGNVFAVESRLLGTSGEARLQRRSVNALSEIAAKAQGFASFDEYTSTLARNFAQRTDETMIYTAFGRTLSPQDKEAILNDSLAEWRDNHLSEVSRTLGEKKAAQVMDHIADGIRQKLNLWSKTPSLTADEYKKLRADKNSEEPATLEEYTEKVLGHLPKPSDPPSFDSAGHHSVTLKLAGEVEVVQTVANGRVEETHAVCQGKVIPMSSEMFDALLKNVKDDFSRLDIQGEEGNMSLTYNAPKIKAPDDLCR